MIKTLMDGIIFFVTILAAFIYIPKINSNFKYPLLLLTVILIVVYFIVLNSTESPEHMDVKPLVVDFKWILTIIGFMLMLIAFIIDYTKKKNPEKIVSHSNETKGVVSEDLSYQLSDPERIKIQEKVLTESITKRLPKFLTERPKPAPIFVGRERNVTEINKRFDLNANLIFISGIGGIGKTTLIQNFLDRFQNEFKHIAWITCSDGKPIKKALIQSLNFKMFGIDDELSVGPYKKKYAILSLALSQLTGNNLLIIDDANDYNDVIFHRQSGIIRNLNSWKIIIISRANPDIIPEKEKLFINPLPKREALKLFYKYSREEYPTTFLKNLANHLWKSKTEKDNDKAINQILSSIENHTLTIELLGNNFKALNPNGYTYQEMAQDLKNGVLCFPNQRKINVFYDKYKGSSVELKKVLIEMYKIVCTDYQREALHLISLLPSQPVSRPDIQFILISNKMLNKEFDENITGLKQMGLIQKYTGMYMSNEEKLKMHPIVQEILREEIKPSIKNSKKFVDNIITKLTDNASNSNQLRIFIEYSESIIEHIQRQTEDNRMTPIYDAMASAYQKMNIADESIKYFERAIKIEEKGYDDIAVDTSNLHLASLYKKFAELFYPEEKYINYREKAVYIIEQLMLKTTAEINLEDLLTDYYDLKEIFTINENYNKELDYLLKIVGLREKIYDLDNKNITSMQNLVTAYTETAEHLFQKTERYEEALGFQMKAVKMQEIICGINSMMEERIILADGYSTLASLYFKVINFKESFEHYQKAVTLKEQLLIEGAGKSAKFMNGLINDCHSLGWCHIHHRTEKDIELAYQYFTKAYDIVTKLTEKNKLKTAFSLFYIAESLTARAKNDKDEQESNYQEEALNKAMEAEVLMIEERGPNFEGLNGVYSTIAKIYMDMWDIEQAFDYSNRAIAIADKNNIPLKSMGYLYGNHALCLAYKEYYPDAIEYEIKSIEILEKHLYKYHPDLATGHANLAFYYKKVDNYEESEFHEQEALRIREKIYEEGHFLITETSEELASIHAIRVGENSNYE